MPDVQVEFVDGLERWSVRCGPWVKPSDEVWRELIYAQGACGWLAGWAGPTSCATVYAPQAPANWFAGYKILDGTAA